jgi:hypothetical protein
MTNPKIMIKLLVAGAFAFAWHTQAQNLDLDFNTPGEYTGNFANPAPGGALNLTENPTDGVGGSGGLANGNLGDGNSIYQSGTWNFSAAGDTVTESLMTEFSNPNTVSGGQFQLGIGANTSFYMAGAAGSQPDYGSYRLSKSSSGADNFKVQYQYSIGGSTTSGGQSAAFALVPDDWYLFQVVYVNDGSSQYTMTATLYNYGLNGTTPSSTDLLAAEDGTGSAFEQVETVTDSTIASDTGVAAGWRNGNLSSGSTIGLGPMDNFVVTTVPEPQTWVLVLAGTSLLLGINFMRRNKVKA